MFQLLFLDTDHTDRPHHHEVFENHLQTKTFTSAKGILRTRFAYSAYVWDLPTTLWCEPGKHVLQFQGASWSDDWNPLIDLVTSASPRSGLVMIAVVLLIRVDSFERIAGRRGIETLRERRTTVPLNSYSSQLLLYTDNCVRIDLDAQQIQSQTEDGSNSARDFTRDALRRSCQFKRVLFFCRFWRVPWKCQHRISKGMDYPALHR